MRDELSRVQQRKELSKVLLFRTLQYHELFPETIRAAYQDQCVEAQYRSIPMKKILKPKSWGNEKYFLTDNEVK